MVALCSGSWGLISVPTTGSGYHVIGHLQNAHTSIVFASDGGMPEALHWGEALGHAPLDPRIFQRPAVNGGPSEDPSFGVVAESSRAWFGRPGIEGTRHNAAGSAPKFKLERIHESSSQRMRCTVVDHVAALALDIDAELHATSGLLTLSCEIHNRDQKGEYMLNALRIGMPVSHDAQEILTVGSRWGNEFACHRHEWSRSLVAVENRHGRTSHEHLPAVFAGTRDFGEETGSVWACHLGWSGNYEIVCDSTTDARHVIQAGELLGSGEITLAPGESYATPMLYFAFSRCGLNGISHAFHEHLRARPNHPQLPRPVHLNTWEAVYFDHDFERLKKLADRAAFVGVERFVLDDGWFGSRRDDSAGLGDWLVSKDVWPLGLTPLIEHVKSLGMEFGLWVEPEMVNPDSQCFRANPEWALVDDAYGDPLLQRKQLVLDVTRQDVSDYLFDALDSLLKSNDIAYLKWDHNRDLVAPWSDGRLSTHRQTTGVYKLLDRLRAAHPDVEIETCASGGGRVDFGILQHTDRVWTSDSLDALDRVYIQRGFSLLFPPELMGSHIGAPAAHITKRMHRLGFRAAVAIFGAFGIEWNLLDASEEELEDVKSIVELHKRFRPLLHTGRARRIDHPDKTIIAHAVVANDYSEALISITRVSSSHTMRSAPMRIHSLEDHRTYTVEMLYDLSEPLGGAHAQPNWTERDSCMQLTGRHLRITGFVLPEMVPESVVLIRLYS